MSSIFISHSSKDNAISEELARRLQEQNHPSLFLDLDPEKGIVAGQSWERTLYRKLRACRAVVALCTDNYLTSHWCFAEIALARMEGKHVIALKVDPLSPDARMPAILAETQFIDLRTNPEEGYRRLFKGLREEDILGVPGEWDPRKPPYLGLAAFQEEHAPVFFGREEEVRSGVELLDRGSPGLVMVIGASGTGKSSLVRAGMLPRLRRDTERWLVVDPFRPGGDPFAELATSLDDAYRRYAPGGRVGGWERIRDELVAAADLVVAGTGAAEAPPEPGEIESRGPDDDRLARIIQQLEELRERPPDQTGDRLKDFLEWSIQDLRRIAQGEAPGRTRVRGAAGDRNALIDMAAQLRRLVPDRRGAHVLLVIDQFEELLGHDDPDHPAYRFLALLRASLESEHSPLMALGTMRSDFLGAFQRNSALRGIDFETLSLGSMRVDGMRRSIEEPARLATVILEQGLADRLLQDTGTPDALPLLSFTLWRLWREFGGDGEITVAEYDQLGGLHGALAGEADAVLREAVRAGKEDALRTALLRMARVTEDGGYARLAVRWDDEDLIPVHSILERLVERRLLARRGEGDVQMVEVAHEALFRSWDPLRSWLDDHRAALMLIAQIKRDAAIWDDADRSPDTLWRGGRLQQAVELMARKKLDPVERAFIEAGVSGRRRRTRTLTGIAALVFVALASAAAFSYRQKLQADDERARALDLARVSVASERLAYDANTAALILLEVERPEETGFAALKMREAMNAGLSIVLGSSGAWITVAAFSPDGSRVAIGNTLGRVEVMRADGSGRPLVLDGHVQEITTLAFSPDGSRLVTGSSDGTARVWAVDSGDSVATLPGDGAEVRAVRFSPDGRRVVVASKEVRLWNADGSGAPWIFAGHVPHIVRSAAFSPDGRYVASAAEDSTVQVWSVDGSGAPVVLRGHTDRVTAATFSRDGRRIVSASYDGTARVWDVRGESDPIMLAGHTGPVVAVAFDPSGGRVVTASHDSTARVWDVDGPRDPVVLAGHRDRVVDVTFSPDGDRVVTASHDGTARVWNAGGAGDPLVFVGHANAVEVAAFDATGQHVLTASRDGARVWHANLRSDPVVVRRLGGTVQAAAFSDDGSRLAAVPGGRQRVVSIYPVNGTGDPVLVPLEGLRREVMAVEFSPDGRYLVTVDLSGVARVWPIDPGAPPFSAPWGDGPVSAIAFSPDGSSLLTAGSDDTVRVWRASGSGGRLVATSLGEHRSVAAARFSPDATQGVTTSRDGSIRRWTLTRGGVGSAMGDSAGPQVTAAVFGPAGDRLMTRAADSTVQLWDPVSGDSLATLHEDEDALTVASFNPDGTFVLTASAKGRTSIWRADGTGYPVVLLDDGLPVRAAAFSEDGDHVLTLSGDGTLKRWSTITHQLLREALSSATNQCLEPSFRERYLGQSSVEARDRYRACESVHGRD